MKPKHYTTPRKYTQDELDAAALSDIEVDLACAIRDGLTDYAEQLQKQLDRISKGESAHQVALHG